MPLPPIYYGRQRGPSEAESSADPILVTTFPSPRVLLCVNFVMNENLFEILKSLLFFHNCCTPVTFNACLFMSPHSIMYHTSSNVDFFFNFNFNFFNIYIHCFKPKQSYMMELPKTLPIYQNHNFIILGPYLDGKKFSASISLLNG